MRYLASALAYSLRPPVGRNEGYYKSLKDQVVVVPADVDRPQDPETPVHFKAGELINFEYCHKVSSLDALIDKISSFWNSIPIPRP